MPNTPPPSLRTRAPAANPLRAWSAVITLALAVFVVTVTEMMPIGLLPQISSDLHVSEGAAGLSVTMYGLVAGLSAPAMTSWTRRLDRRLLVLAILGVFVVGNIATALTSNYPQLLAVRLGMGLFHGLTWSIIATVAARLVPDSAEAKSTATVFSGISLALVLGVPAGAVLGTWAGWQAAFGVLAAIAALTCVAALLVIPALPQMDSTLERPRMRALITSCGGIGVVLAVTALVVVGNYAAYTYIAPFLIQDRAVPPSLIGGFLIAYGVAGVVGNVVAGAAVTRVRSLRAVLFTGVVIMVVSLVALSLAPVYTTVTVTSFVVWGMSYSALPVALQTAILRIAASAREAGTALYVLVFNVSIAAGSFIGAVGIDTAGTTAPILIGAAFCGAGACLTLRVRASRSGPPSPPAGG